MLTFQEHLLSRMSVPTDHGRQCAVLVSPCLCPLTLSNHFGCSIAVEVIVLHLKVLSQRQKNVQCLLVQCFLLDAHHSHSQSDREIKGVEGGLIDDNEVVSGLGDPTISTLLSPHSSL